MADGTPAPVEEEDRERQLEEIQALASIFGGEDEFSTQSSQLRSFVESGDEAFVDRSLATLSFELRVAVDGDDDEQEDGGGGAAGSVLCLSCAMPAGYPSSVAASITGSVEHMLVRRADLAELNAMLQSCAAEHIGEVRKRPCCVLTFLICTDDVTDDLPRQARDKCKEICAQTWMAVSRRRRFTKSPTPPASGRRAGWRRWRRRAARWPLRRRSSR